MSTPVIHTTATLGKLLKVQPCHVPDDAETWNAHLFAVHGKKAVVMIHAQTRYSIYMTDVLKQHIADFPTFFNWLLHLQLTLEWPMHTKRIEEFLAIYGEAVIAPSNNDKSTLGVMNTNVSNMKYRLDHRDFDPLDPRSVMLEAWAFNSSIAKAPKGVKGRYGNCLCPGEEMASRIGIPYDHQNHRDRMSMALFGR